ncbi:hypothetical protein SAMN05428949_1234 [Chitinophaga sp. YR627]|uniref:hypothetical protein n=1 Tax=Chitinophaga sp. YR627 TaxID=1881041 RepID=UPI0008EC6A38|nr:hypothetical protein [Chitinophaga sp. YR627]SFM90359.1 hypothetical protein SAMN05428949_1234 [Chitinophaga sp. YR627]
MYAKFSLLIYCLLLSVCQDARGQIFGQNGQVLQDADMVATDTIFYTIKREMPFDRFFILQCRLPKDIIVKGFDVTPINKHLERHVTRRDYKMMLLLENVSRDSMTSKKKQKTFKAFKDPEQLITFYSNQRMKVQKNGEFTDLYLKIPPLDPNRDYRIAIFTIDPKRIGDFERLSEQLDRVLPTDNRIDGSASASLESQYNSFREKVKGGLQLDTYYEYLSNNNCNGSDSLLKHTRARNFESDRYNTHIEYRFILSKNEIDRNTAEKLDEGRYVSIVTDHNLNTIFLPYVFLKGAMQGLKDAENSPVEFNSRDNATYHVSVLINDSVKSFDGKKSIADFHEFQTLPDVTFNKDTAGVICWADRPLTNKGCEESLVSMIRKKHNIYNTLSNHYSHALRFCHLISQFLMREALRCPCNENGIKSMAERNNLTTILGLFYKADQYIIDSVLTGAIALHQPDIEPKKEIDDRMQLLDSSLLQLDMLRDFVRKVRITVDDIGVRRELSASLEELTTFREQLQSNRNYLDALSKLIAAVRSKAARKTQLSEKETLTQGSTEVLNFKTASQFKIVPDFGLVAIFDLPQQMRVQSLVPYVGFNINFRSIDKNIAQRHIRFKTLWYRLSFVGGITVSSIKIEGKREDMFSNLNLVGGLGFRVNNYLKITGGGVFFKKLSVNQLTNETSIGTSPFIGLSVDYELQDLFGGFVKLFK